MASRSPRFACLETRISNSLRPPPSPHPLFPHPSALLLTETITFSAALPWQNFAELDTILADVSNPQSKNYGNWMTQEEVNSLTAPLPEHRAAARAMLDRPRDAPAEERLVEPFSLVPAEQAHADLRAAAPGAARQPGAAGGMDVDGIATTDVAGHACDRAREDPWMALLHGPFLAFGQDDCCHDSSSVRPACAGMRSTDAHPAVAAPTQAA